MAKKLLFVLITSLVVSCSKDNERIQLTVSYFELNECFSTMTLNGDEVVITDQNSYQEFQDSIRRYFYDYCDTVSLPEINFEESIFLGVYTQTSGCSAQYLRSVYYSEESNYYDYEISVIQEGLCEMLITSFNCAIVPKQSESEVVNFKVSY